MIQMFLGTSVKRKGATLLKRLAPFVVEELSNDALKQYYRLKKAKPTLFVEVDGAGGEPVHERINEKEHKKESKKG